MTQIRMCVQLGKFRLEYEGTRAFFERAVEPLLGGVPRTSVAAAATPATEDAGATASGNVEFSPPPVAAAPVGYRPPSYEFGQFVQKLGPEAGEPDRQIVAFVFFLWNYVKKDTVREDEVEGCFRAIGLKPPPDAAAHYADLAQRLRFLQSGAEAGTWSLTQKGANYVKTRLLGAL
jgi:hypothetical protein